MDPPKRAKNAFGLKRPLLYTILPMVGKGLYFPRDTQMNDPSSDHRANYRFLAGLKATLLLGDGCFSCQATDLDRKGVMVEGDFEAEGHAEATIQLASATEDLRFQAHGRVAHISTNTENGHTKLGIEFDSIPADQNEALDLLQSRVIEGMNPAALAQLDRGASIIEIRDVLSKIPLPHRIMLARRAQTPERAFLRHDESPQVLEALCRNPQLSRAELMQLLKLPMLLPTTLEVLSRDPRWTSHEEIRVVIATHPRVPFPVAERMIEDLSLVNIRQLIRRAGLKPALKDRLVATIPHKKLQGW